MQKGKKYNNPYLTDVLFKIGFNPILKLAGNNKELADPFYQKIFEKFPNVKFTKNTINVTIDLNSKNTETEDGDLTWIFSSADNMKRVELCATSLTLYYNGEVYEHFRDFLEEIILLLNSLKQYNTIELRYVTLRYVNQLTEFNVEEIKKYINPKLFNEYILNLDDDEKFTQIFTKLNIKKNEYDMIFQYGFFNPTVDPEFHKDFILDYECTTTNINYIDDIQEKLKSMNKFIFKKFDESTTNILKNKMEEEK